MNRNYYWIFLLVFIASCHKEGDPTIPTAKGVYVVNEGLFNWGAAEVSFYNPADNRVTNELFKAANGYSLGDVGQSMYVHDSTAFIVVNNSAKIEVVQLPSFKKLRTINISGSSPRCFYPVNDSVAYVTELYAKKIWVINYVTGAVIQNIPADGWTENIVKVGSDVFVQQKINDLVSGSFATLLKINTANHTAQHNTNFGGRDINGIVKDNFDRIWVAVDEDTVLHLKAGFYCFDKNLVEQKSFFFSSYNHHPGNLCIDAAGENVFYSDKEVYSFSVNSSSVPPAATISMAGKTIYCMRMDPVTDEVYISDALDYIQPSAIYRYSKSGSLIHSFTAGVIAGNFAFTHE